MAIFQQAQVIQFAVWTVALVEFILGIYLLSINVRSKSNQHVSMLLILFGINTFMQGRLITASLITQAYPAFFTLAATTPAIPPALFLISTMLLKPNWLIGRFKWFWQIIYIIIFVPTLLTIFDVIFPPSLWFTGHELQNYPGGLIGLQAFTKGLLSFTLRIIYIYAIPILTAILVLYAAYFDKSGHRTIQQVAKKLTITQFLAVTVYITLSYLAPTNYVFLITITIFAGGYAYTAFWQVFSERHLQRGRLQYRLTALILVISIPILVASSIYLLTKIGDLNKENAVQRLEDLNGYTEITLTTWLESYQRSLDAWLLHPAFTRMDSSAQKLIFEEISEIYPELIFVSTLDLAGNTVARSDGGLRLSYEGYPFFKAILSGEEYSQQTLVEETSGRPVYVMAKPINDEGGELVGVAFYAIPLETINAMLLTNTRSDGEIIFVVDDKNQIIAHPDTELIMGDLVNYSRNPAVASMRHGDDDDLVYFTDEDGISWYAAVRELENNWGVIVQQPERDFFGAFIAFQPFLILLLSVGIVLLGALTFFAANQVIQPIEALTETASAITKGDLSRIAPIESDDQIGVLAGSFNKMTEKLLEIINGLERKVAESTKDLQRHSVQLQAAAEVGRAATHFLEGDVLFQNVVEIIRTQFDLYYVGLYLVDVTREWAYLRAGTGSAGKTMLEMQYRIKVGEGMIGWSIANAQTRVSGEADEVADSLTTEDLSETRSEAVIPLRVREEVIGAITVQSTRTNAFDEVSISAFETMADLVSTAIENARHHSESEQMLEASRRLYEDRIEYLWSDKIQKTVAYKSTSSGTTKLGSNGPIIMEEGPHTLTIPIIIRGTTIGELQTSKPADSGPWQPGQIQVIERIVDQLSVALEGAQLFEESQQRAYFEQLAREVTTRIRETLNIESVVQTAAAEFRRALDLNEVEIRLKPELGDPKHE